MESTVENVLILTLGTGLNLDKDTDKEFTQQRGLSEREKRKRMQEIFSSGDKFSYRKTIYCMPATDNEQQWEIESEFVAEPLVRLEKPRRIFIIGTVKSSWSSFYNKFAADKDFERFYTLFEIETLNGKDTENDRLQKIAKQIEEIYNKDKVLYSLYSADEPSVELHILLTKYGLNDEELKYNYKIISSIEKCFQKERHYKISFDITHSFRSIPIYNLVILNYLKHITQYRVEISHVYYGNVDVSKEAGKAYIVDLRDLIGVLELTNGVCEFRDTGNTVALLRDLSDSEADLNAALERFDWATQINDYKAIVDSLEGLQRLIHTPVMKSRYADLRNMLARVLEEQFISEERLKELTEDLSYPDHVGAIQLCICKWFRNQNRYGLAIATALETLRSFLVPFYLRRNGRLDEEIKLADCQNENNRKSAVDVLTHLSGFAQSGEIEVDSEELELLCKVEKLRVQVKPIRDRFAHNLMSVQEKTVGLEGTTEPNGYLNDKKMIDDFVSALDNLFNSSKEKIARAYYKKPIKQEIRKINNDDKEIRLVICNADKYKDKRLSEYEYLKRSNNNQNYDVYVLPEQLARVICGRKKQKKQEEVILEAFLIQQYIEAHFETERLTVILDDFKYFQCVFYPAVLIKRNIKVGLLQYNKENSTSRSLQMISSSYKLELESYEVEKKAEEKYISAEWAYEVRKL